MDPSRHGRDDAQALRVILDALLKRIKDLEERVKNLEGKADRAD